MRVVFHCDSQTQVIRLQSKVSLARIMISVFLILRVCPSGMGGGTEKQNRAHWESIAFFEFSERKKILEKITSRLRCFVIKLGHTWSYMERILTAFWKRVNPQPPAKKRLLADTHDGAIVNSWNREKKGGPRGQINVARQLRLMLGRHNLKKKAEALSADGSGRIIRVDPVK